MMEWDTNAVKGSHWVNSLTIFENKKFKPWLAPLLSVILIFVVFAINVLLLNSIAFVHVGSCLAVNCVTLVLEIGTDIE